jgi:hypothetical protein
MGLVVACLSLEGAAASADGFRGDLTVAGRFDERPPIAEQGNWIGSIAPELGFSRHAAFANYDAFARRRFDSMLGNANPRPAADEARGTFNGATSENLSWDVLGDYYRSRDPLDQDPRFTPSPGVTQTSHGRAHLSLWRGEALYQISNHDNTAPSQANAWSQAATAAVYPLRTPQGAWLMTGRYQDWTTNNVRTLAAVSALTGYRRYHTPEVTSEVQLGVVSRNREAGGYENPELAWTVAFEGLLGAMGLPLGSRMRVSHEVQTTGSAELWHEVGGLKWTAEYSRSIQAEGGSFSTPTTRDYAALGIENSRLPVTLTLRGSYGYSKPPAGFGDALQTWRGEAGLARAMQPWLTGRVGYSYLWQKDLGGADYHRSRAEVALTASLQ